MVATRGGRLIPIMPPTRLVPLNRPMPIEDSCALLGVHPRASGVPRAHAVLRVRRRPGASTPLWCTAGFRIHTGTPCSASGRRDAPQMSRACSARIARIAAEAATPATAAAMARVPSSRTAAAPNRRSVPRAAFAREGAALACPSEGAKRSSLARKSYMMFLYPISPFGQVRSSSRSEVTAQDSTRKRRAHSLASKRCIAQIAARMRFRMTVLAERTHEATNAALSA